MSDSQATPATPWLRNVSPADLGVYVTVVALLALAGLAPAAWRWADVQLRVDLAFYGVEVDALDPWGQAWILNPDGSPRSIGPNGVDEAGGGDDLTVGSPAEVDNWRLTLHDALSGLLCLLAVVLIVGWETVRQVRRQLLTPRAPLGVELGRAVAWAMPLGAVLAGTLWALERLEGSAPLIAALDDWLAGVLLIPVPLAVAGSIYLVSFLLILGLRLRLAAPAIAPESNSGLEASDSSGR